MSLHMASSTSSAPTNQQQHDLEKNKKPPSSFRDADRVAQLTTSNDLHEYSCFPPRNLVGPSSAMYLGADHASVFQHPHRQEDVRSSRSAAVQVLVLKADACAPPGMTYNGDNNSDIESYYFYNTSSTILSREQEKCTRPETAALWRREKQGATRYHYSTTITSEEEQNATPFYHDYHSNQPANSSSSIATEKPFSTKGGVKMPFPAKLFHMLEYIDLYEPDLAKIISWQPHGRCFRTHDVKKMEEIILPRFFKHNRYSSFRRQLNIWCFKRVSQQGPDNDSYYHDLFLRSKLYLCHGINRLPQNKRAAVERSHISLACKNKKEDEPRFSLFPALPPSSYSAPWSSSTSSLSSTWCCDSKNKSRTPSAISSHPASKGGERDIANTAPPVTQLRIVNEILKEADMPPQTTGGNDSSVGGRGDMCDGDITMNHQEKGREPGTMQEDECLPLLTSRMVGVSKTNARKYFVLLKKSFKESSEGFSLPLETDHWDAILPTIYNAFEPGFHDRQSLPEYSKGDEVPLGLPTRLNKLPIEFTKIGERLGLKTCACKLRRDESWKCGY